MPWVAIAGALSLYRIVSWPGSRTWISVASGSGLALVLLLAVLYSGHKYSLMRFQQEIDILTYNIAMAIHKTAQPGEAVLTNAPHYNSPMEGSEDRYILYKPALAYYADRVVRGDIKKPGEFENVLKRRDDFTYFAFIMSLKQDQEVLFKYLHERYPTLDRKRPGILFFHLE